MKLDIEKIKNILIKNQGSYIRSKQGLKVSSVIIPLFLDKGGRDGIVLTKRSKHLKSHPGQVSFPGGIFNPNEDDTLLEAALREWEEETGEPRNTLEVIGKYKEIRVRTGFHITPYVSIYRGDFHFNFNTEEVDFMFLFYLDEIEGIPFYKMPIQDRDYPEIYYFQHPSSLIWGATCEILVSFLREFCDFHKTGILVKPNLIHPPFFDPNKNVIQKD